MIYSTLFTLLALLILVGSNALGLTAGPWLKMITSTGFLAIALTAGALDSAYGQIVLIALVFSWWGDLFLISKREKIFLCGLVAFFLGHAGYVAAFLVHGVDGKWLAISVVLGILPIAVVTRWLNPHLGRMRIPVYAYMAVITLMVACALGAWGHGATILVVVGAVLFYLSDLFVARERFVTPTVWNRHIGLPLYYVGQIILAASIAWVHPAAT